ncbi:hypothetical protein ET475_07750 [Microbacterium protaetiae]|uniref:WxL domain-containing protein n=1 Tax=Microbacterium protaetiae TaxID=2509458 RepID=A0A4P6EDS9_9MICO|nr:hypothetical protein [Microbacterium protaetiae]QAY59896.1 hypothetical protein ET475_07750 [Microbacterium protaetiae]
MKRNLLRIGAVSFGALVLVCAGSAVALADDQDSVDVFVDVAPVETPGVLALSVDSGETTLTESGSTDAVRQFTGVLPNVTVTDTRTAEEIPDGANWYVLGSVSDFTSDDATISADHFGWSPHFVGGDDEGDGVVSVGGDVETVLDGQRGLVDQELLYLGDALPAVDGGGSWTANADLFLRVAASTTPGEYASVVTLSLFE